MILLFIGMGGFFGAILRFLVSGWVQKVSGSFFPYGTLSVNVLGSLLIGFLAMLFEDVVAPEWKAFAVTGFLGALTTFSTFSYETLVMVQGGEFFRALSNMVVNVFTCLFATFLGVAIYMRIFRI